MSREKKVDPPQPVEKLERPPSQPLDPIKQDPKNSTSEPSPPDTEPQPGKRPEWDWVEHED
jgi:hypothetical protein